jgi:hypothetical protein
MGKRKGAHRVLMGKLAGKRQLARSVSRWEDNTKTDRQGMNWAA